MTTDLVYLKNDNALTDSLTVAESFGKRHADVIRTIKSLIGNLPQNGVVTDDLKNEGVVNGRKIASVVNERR